MITYEYDAKTLASVERKLGLFKDEAPKALKNAVNDTAKMARKELASEAQKTYAIKTGGFNRYMKIRSATKSRPEAVIRATGAPIEIKKFSVNGGKGAKLLSVMINRKKGRKEFKNDAFVNNIAKKGQTRQRDTKKGAKGTSVKHVAVAMREAEKRLNIKSLFTVSILQMIGSEKYVYGVVEPHIESNLQENIEKQVRKILEA